MITRGEERLMRTIHMSSRFAVATCGRTRLHLRHFHTSSIQNQQEVLIRRHSLIDDVRSCLWLPIVYPTNMHFVFESSLPLRLILSEAGLSIVASGERERERHMPRNTMWYSMITEFAVITEILMAIACRGASRILFCKLYQGDSDVFVQRLTHLHAALIHAERTHETCSSAMYSSVLVVVAEKSGCAKS